MPYTPEQRAAALAAHQQRLNSGVGVVRPPGYQAPASSTSRPGTMQTGGPTQWSAHRPGGVSPNAPGRPGTMLPPLTPPSRPTWPGTPQTGGPMSVASPQVRPMESMGAGGSAPTSSMGETDSARGMLDTMRGQAGGMSGIPPNFGAMGFGGAMGGGMQPIASKQPASGGVFDAMRQMQQPAMSSMAPVARTMEMAMPDANQGRQRLAQMLSRRGTF